jgi:hypothetical protein
MTEEERMEERAPMSIGQAVAGLVLFAFVVAWLFDRYSIVVQVAP